MPDRYFCQIIEHEEIASSIFAVTIGWKSEDMPRPGQFIHIKCGDGLLLRRPISVCSVGNNTLKFVFEVKGDGTRWLSERCAGTALDIIAALGNGFSLPDGDIIIVGGGIGVPPMLFAAQAAKGSVAAILGFRNAERVILEHEFNEACDTVTVTTDDGSYGNSGPVIKPLETLLKNGKYSAVLACGSRAMLSVVTKVCADHGVACQVSMEERMGCGVGACLVCACATKIDGNDHMSRVCKDGPVFNAEEVVW